MFKKVSSIFLGLIVVLGLAACSTEDVEASSYYVAIDINPSIEFIVDEDDIITSYNLLNEDAEILVADIDFVGMNVDEAVELFITVATEAGYIDVDSEDNAVLITVLGEDEDDTTAQVRNRLRERVGRYFVKNYIVAEVLTDEFTDEDLILQAEELGVTPAKLSLALLIMQTETEEVYTLEGLLDTPVKDLVQIIKTYHEDVFTDYTQAQLRALEQKRNELIERHQQRFENWIENHPEMTEEEITQAWNRYQTHVKAINRTNWENRLNKWKQDRTEKEQDQTEETE